MASYITDRNKLWVINYYIINERKILYNVK